MFLLGLNGWVLVYKLSCCGIDSHCRYLNFRYCDCFERGAPWHSGNYNVYIRSKMRMSHDKSTKLKSFLPLHTVLSNYVCHLQQSSGTLDSTWSNNSSCIWQELRQIDFYPFDQKNVSCLSSCLLPTHAYLKDSRYST